eukprot:257091-Pleurochrysis_carterae.AAC.11
MHRYPLSSTRDASDREAKSSLFSAFCSARASNTHRMTASASASARPFSFSFCTIASESSLDWALSYDGTSLLCDTVASDRTD